MKKMDKAVETVARALDYVSCAVLFGMMAFVVIYIIVRAIFGYSIFGTFEIVQLSSMTIVAFSLMHNEYCNGNVTIDILDNVLKEGGRKAIMVVSLAITLGICVITAYRMVIFTGIKYMDNSLTPNLHIPVCVFVSILAFAFIMLSVGVAFKLAAVCAGYKWSGSVAADETVQY